ncbi:MAG: PhnD/SsuA/transferrin family substrate-binding protein [Anaerolineales bacterium]
MKKVFFGSCMAPNADEFVHDVLAFVRRATGIPLQNVDTLSWREREAALDQGEIQLGWICGLTYVWKADARPPLVELLAAPVMSGKRYQNQPVYYSDVIARRSAHFTAFEALRDTRWGYNEPRSHSGYNLVRYELARRGLDASFFKQVQPTGSHQESIDAILRGEIDAAAIDTTVLETELQRRPALVRELRVVDTFGPSPIPPFVAAAGLDHKLRSRLTQSLVSMHESSSGQRLLAQHRVARFARVEDHDYDMIREMDRLARTVSL